MALGITAISEAPISSLGGVVTLVQVTGIQANTAVGNVDPAPDVSLVGVQATTVIGTVTIQAGASATLQGQVLNTAVGNTTEITADANVDVVGINLTSVAGDPTIKGTATVDLLGISAATFIGQADAGPDVILGGQDLFTAQNGAGVIVTADANVDVTGQALTITLGTAEAIPNTLVDVTGQDLTLALNSVTVVPSVEVDVVGQPLTTAVGSVSIIAWSNVDPDVTNIWTEVNLGVTNNWAEVDIAA